MDTTKFIICKAVFLLCDNVINPLLMKDCEYLKVRVGLLNICLQYKNRTLRSPKTVLSVLPRSCSLRALPSRPARRGSLLSPSLGEAGAREGEGAPPSPRPDRGLFLNLTGALFGEGKLTQVLSPTRTGEVCPLPPCSVPTFLSGFLRQAWHPAGPGHLRQGPQGSGPAQPGRRLPGRVHPVQPVRQQAPPLPAGPGDWVGAGHK